MHFFYSPFGDWPLILMPFVALPGTLYCTFRLDELHTPYPMSNSLGVSLMVVDTCMKMLKGCIITASKSQHYLGQYATFNKEDAPRLIVQNHSARSRLGAPRIALRHTIAHEL